MYDEQNTDPVFDEDVEANDPAETNADEGARRRSLQSLIATAPICFNRGAPARRPGHFALWDVSGYREAPW
jgi:hypothetical protein